MPTTDHVIDKGASDAAGAAEIPLVVALQSLSRAYQKTTIYPAGHPSVIEALSAAVKGFEATLSETGHVAAVVSRDHFLVDDHPLAEGSETLTSLACLLFDMDIAALEFSEGLGVEELEQLIRILGRASKEGLKGSALVAELSSGGGEKVRARAIDYSALQFSNGSRDPSERQPDRDVWENVSRILADPEPGRDKLSPEELAAEVSHEIREQEGSGVGLLKKRIHHLHRRTKSLDLPRREEIEKRLSAFVTSLSPKLRKDLLRVDPELPEESIELMTKVVDQLPDSDLLQALRELDHIGARMPDQLLTLLNKLVRISHKRPTLASGLQQRLAKWGVPAASIAGSPDNLRSALEEVFQKRARSDFIPQTHRTLLDTLSRQTVTVGEYDFDDRYRDPRDGHAVRLQASEIAARLLRGGSGEQHRAGIFAFLASAADSLIEGRQFEVVRDAAISARTYSMLKSESEANRRSADGFLEEFRSKRRISLLLEHGCDEDGFDEAALALLSLGGQPALESVLDFLAEDPPAAVSADLSSFAKGRSLQALTRAVSSRMNRDSKALRPLLSLLREIPADGALPLLEKLFRHEQCRVRRHALQVLCDVDKRPGSPVRHLLRGMRDPSPRVTALAMKRLIDLVSEDSSDLLSDYIEGEINGVIPSPAYIRRAARELLDRGDYGTSRLCVSLDRLRRELHPRKIMSANVIAKEMGRSGEDPLIKNCLRKWKLAPGRMIAWLLPGIRSYGRKRSG